MDGERVRASCAIAELVAVVCRGARQVIARPPSLLVGCAIGMSPVTSLGYVVSLH
jgi:hypothetical protein